MDEQTKLQLVQPFKHRTNRTVAELTQRLRNNAALPHVARFGDGEIFCCLADHKLVSFAKNVDGHDYSVSLARALLESLRVFLAADDLWLGNWLYWPFNAWIHGLVDSFGGQCQWCSHNLFMHVRQKPLDHVRDLYMAIRGVPRRKVIVGRPALARLTAFFGDAIHVPVPPKNGWREYPDVLRRVRTTIQPDDLALIGFGMPAKPLMADMMQAVPDATYFDVGSGMDCLIPGKRSRSHQPSWPTLQQLYGGLRGLDQPRRIDCE